MSRGAPDWLPPLNPARYPGYWSDFYSTWEGSISAGSYVEILLGVVPDKHCIAITSCHPSCKDATNPSKFECFSNADRFRCTFFTGYEVIEPIHYPLFEEGRTVTARIYNYGTADQEYAWFAL